MSAERSIVIVGAGLAGASAAGELRESGFEGDIRLIGAERHAPYIRPPLSKGYLSGAESRESADVHPEDWYQEHRIGLVTGVRVTGIDAAEHTVALDLGTELRYDTLLLATGSSPRRIMLPGIGLAGVTTLRTVDDSTALHRELADGGRRVVLIGSGWIGMEVAATARTLGNEVTVLDRGSVALSSAIGAELGAVFERVHIDNGVVIRHNVQVERIEGEGRVEGVRLFGGELVPADVVVVAIGAEPDVALARDAGLAVDDGVLADEHLRTTDPDIFVAGDIANAMHPVTGFRIRSEHWANAQDGGRAAARAMLDPEAVYDAIPYFYTDQFDLGMEYSGYIALARDGELVYRGDLAEREFIAFWVSADNRVVAGMNVNVWDVNEQVQTLIRDAGPVDRDRLGDPDVPLDAVAGPEGRR